MTSCLETAVYAQSGMQLKSTHRPAVTGLDEGTVSLRRSAVRRSGIFRSGLLPARPSVGRHGALRADVDPHRIPACDSAPKQLLGELILNPVRDYPTQRTGTVDPIVALLGEKVLRRVGDLDDYLQLN